LFDAPFEKCKGETGQWLPCHIIVACTFYRWSRCTFYQKILRYDFLTRYKYQTKRHSSHDSNQNDKNISYRRCLLACSMKPSTSQSQSADIRRPMAMSRSASDAEPALHDRNTTCKAQLISWIRRFNVSLVEYYRGTSQN
jgi:hypothetical protein